MTSTSDPSRVGGPAALAGFLYQLLGSAAGLTHASILELEHSGEDALFSLPTGETLVQYKYAADSRSIKPNELAAILLKLREHDPTDARVWELRTNRPLTEVAEALRRNKIDDKDRRLKNVKTNNRKVIRDLGEQLKVSRLSFATLFDELAAYGQRFGLTHEEVQNGATQFVGYLISRFAPQPDPPARIEQALLNEYLTNLTEPMSLRAEDRKRDITIELNRQAGMQGGPTLEDTLPRTALQGMFDTDEAIVLVTGPGGCGKTLSVLRAIADQVDAQSVFGTLLLSNDGTDLEEVIRSWRSRDPLRGRETLPRGLERLRIANQKHDGWIVIVGLDGVDERGWETAEKQRLIYRLVEFVREARMQALPTVPMLKLVFTCRDSREASLFLTGPGVGGNEPDGIDPVDLGLFDDSELDLIWSDWFPNLPSLPPLAATATHSNRQLLTESSLPATVEEQRIRQALKNPTMLGCFKKMSHREQLSILEGEDVAWNGLIQLYIQWFTHKVCLRRSFKEQTVRSMLAKCARASSANPGLSELEEHWIEPASSVTGASINAHYLFEDAVTSGLVEPSDGSYRVSIRRPVKWQWRYPFVEQHLCELI